MRRIQGGPDVNTSEALSPTRRRLKHVSRNTERSMTIYINLRLLVRRGTA